MRIEAFFDYKWKGDKQLPFWEANDEALFLQLPLDVKIKLVKDFIHSDFLNKFKKTFVFPNNDITNEKIKHARYGWNDEPYYMFMFDVLRALAVRREDRLSVLQEQNDEVLEVLFFSKGSYAAGFVLNRSPKFCMKFTNPKNSNVINAFACTYHLRSDWIYKTITVCEGFSIRKRDW